MKLKLISSIFTLSILCSPAASFSAPEPTFNCNAKDLSSAEKLICTDPELTELDHEMNSVYKAAVAVDHKTVEKILRTEQVGWVKGRNDCWKESDLKKCIQDSYLRRIAELQARYRLISPTETIYYGCDNNPANEIIVNYFPTKLRSVTVERGDKTFILFDDSNGAATHYYGRNEALGIKNGTVEFMPEYQAPNLICTPKMHPSWDKDHDGINDCEKDGSCDHTVNYTKPRP